MKKNLLIRNLVNHPEGKNKIHRSIDPQPVRFNKIGLDPVEAVNYVALQDRDGAILRDRMERIAAAARQIIVGVAAALLGSEVGR